MNKTIYLLLSLTLLANIAFASKDTVRIRHEKYTVVFDKKAHIPFMVQYSLSPENICGKNDPRKLSRKNMRFTADPTLAKTDYSHDYGYKKTGYEQGHMVPAADMACQGSGPMYECFYYTNICPQTKQLNEDKWGDLENWIRGLCKRSGSSLDIWMGNYYNERSKTIGTNKIVVPDSCWKVIYSRKEKQYHAFVMPNTNNLKGIPYKSFKRSVSHIESTVGIKFSK